MKHTTYLLAFGTFALGLAMAASNYHLKISNPTWVNGTELQPGDYRVQVQGDKVRIAGQNNSIEVPSTVQTSAQKFPATSIRSDDVNGKLQLQEIDFGGTKTSILFKAGTGGAGGAQ
ncbi:MAG TPA: hypothetical protein VN754_08275 [Candidatus Binataceae bacterium]|nr:hypothetical protein [Candidatus Binataceae bacterium]